MTIYAWRTTYGALWCAIAHTVEEARTMIRQKYSSMQEKEELIVNGDPTMSRNAECTFAILNREDCSLF